MLSVVTHQIASQDFWPRTSSLNVFSPSPYTYSQIRSMSSQSVTMPCSSGYRIFSRPRSSVAAFCPMKTSPSSAPASTRRCFGRPTHDGKKHLGASSPAKPARIVPEPLSRTIGALWRDSAMVRGPSQGSGRIRELRLNSRRFDSGSRWFSGIVFCLVVSLSCVAHRHVSPFPKVGAPTSLGTEKSSSPKLNKKGRYRDWYSYRMVVRS